MPTAPAIVLHIGRQTIRLPVEQLVQRGAGVVARLEQWKREAPGAQLAMYSTVKGAANVMLPFLPVLLAPAVNSGLLPALPPRPRHTDPIVFVLGYAISALPFSMARGEWRLTVDESGDVTGLDWSGAPLGGAGAPATAATVAAED
jgi:hypothetical protein